MTNGTEDHVRCVADDVPESVEDMQRDLAAIDEVIARGRFKPDWASLQQHRTPQWFEDAKFGIFVHWGVYSVPSFGSEWYSRNMYIQGSKEFEHHVKTYGPQKEFGYKDFIPMFKAERFDPNAWADLFRQAGARYVVPVAEHHDGFQMYKSRLSHWNAVEMGPHRDVLGELSKAFNERGLVNGASSHRVEHWFFMGHGKEFDSDIHEPLKRGDFYGSSGVCVGVGSLVWPAGYWRPGSCRLSPPHLSMTRAMRLSRFL